MLKENHQARQEPGRRRRWFDDEGLELIVWHEPDGCLEGFQLCYATPDGERALTWRSGAGFSHARVDGGDASPLKNETPVLTPDGTVPWEEIARRFEGAGAQLEAPLRELIFARLQARN